MSFFKKYALLLVGGVVALLLLCVVAFFMFKFRGEYVRVQQDLRSNLTRLENLHQRNPFPSEENVDGLNRNLHELENYLYSMLDALSAQQPEVEAMERAEFPSEIERTTRRLRSLADSKGVEIAEGVAFGFQRYSAGHLPVEEHVPRLVVQLRSVDRLCELLFNAEIRELRTVQREVFDEERSQERSREREELTVRRTRRMEEPELLEVGVQRREPRGVEGLYTWERYTFEYKATDRALRAVLNRLAANPALIVVRKMEVKNELATGTRSAAARLTDRLRPAEARQSLRPDARDREALRLRDGEKLDGEEGQPLRHEDRVIAGRELLHVEMIVDVYRFEYSDGSEDPS